MVSKQRNQTGDTIVEVLIAAAIVGLILVGSFSIANASYKQIRMAQERGEAQRVAQSQIEQLRTFIPRHPSYTTSGPALASGLPYPFCFLNGSAESTGVAGGVEPCRQGLVANGERYVVEIERVDETNIDNAFRVTVSWDGLSGKAETLSIDYKVEVGATP